MTISRITRNEIETQAFAADLTKRFGDHPFYALKGDLGAGKTCFVQGLAVAMGIKAAVYSPTFTIINEYYGTNGARLIHADLYRLSGPEELDSIGWDDYLDSGDAMAVEWPERAVGELPARTITIELQIGRSPQDRLFRVHAPDDVVK